MISRGAAKSKGKDDYNVARRASIAERVGIFVDCSSLWHGAYGFAQENGLDRPRVDYSRLMSKMLNGRKLASATAFLLARPGIDVGGFSNALRGMGYEVLVLEATAKTAWHALGNALTDTRDSWDTACVATQDVVIMPTLMRLKEVEGKGVELFAFTPHPFDAPNIPLKVQKLGRDVLLVRKARATAP